MMHTKFRFVVILLGSICACASVPSPRLDDVLSQARRERKPVVLEVFTNWCGPCGRFANETLPNKGVQEAIKNVVFVRYDAEHGPGEQVASRYRVASYPSFLVLDETGALCRRGSGESGSVPGFLDLLRQARSATSSREAVLAELDAHKDEPEAFLSAARWHMAHRFITEAFSLYEQAATVGRAERVETMAAARWEGSKLHRYMDLRQRTVSEARELVTKYPGTTSAGHALYIAALSGDLAQEEITRLIREHLQALPEPPAEPEHARGAEDTAAPLEQAVVIALAARADKEALVAAQRLVMARPQRVGPYLLLARAYVNQGDRSSALAQIARAEAVSKGREQRRGMRILRHQIEQGGELQNRSVDSAAARVTNYFTALEGGLAPLDRVIPISPMLSMMPAKK